MGLHGTATPAIAQLSVLICILQGFGKCAEDLKWASDLPKRIFPPMASILYVSTCSTDPGGLLFYSNVSSCVWWTALSSFQVDNNQLQVIGSECLEIWRYVEDKKMNEKILRVHKQASADFEESARKTDSSLSRANLREGEERRDRTTKPRSATRKTECMKYMISATAVQRSNSLAHRTWSMSS